MYLLDTDILSLLHAGNERVGRKAASVDPAEVATTIVTKIELLRARFEHLLKAADGDQLILAQSWLLRSERLLNQIAVVPFDQKAAAKFDVFRMDRSLRTVGRADLLIGAIASARGATVVTRNLRHFQRIPGLRLENWAD